MLSCRKRSVRERKKREGRTDGGRESEGEIRTEQQRKSGGDTVNILKSFILKKNMIGTCVVKFIG